MSFSDITEDWLAASAKQQLKYTAPLPVQAAVVPYVQRALDSGINLDVCLSAPTGSGKTLCFAMPMVRAVAKAKASAGDTQIRGLVLVPTKALGQQVSKVMQGLTHGTEVKVASICGDKPAEEAQLLQRQVQTADGVQRYYPAADIVVATPPRLMKHAEGTNGISLRWLSFLVMDEADELIGSTFTNLASRVVGFYEEAVRSAAAANRAHSQVLHKMLCSATLSQHVAKIADVKLHNVKYFSLDSEGNKRAATSQREAEAATDWRVATKFALPPTLHEHILIVRDEARHASILKLVQKIRKDPGDKKTVLVFCRQADAARMIGQFFTAAGIPSLEFTSLTSSIDRKKALLGATAGKVDVVVTTDALMRGIDLPGVGHVVMYDPPRTLQQYIHRVGRTARASSVGHTYVLLSRKGPSGTLEDGEVALFRSFDSMVTRTNEVVQEREIQAAVDDTAAVEATKIMQDAQIALVERRQEKQEARRKVRFGDEIPKKRTRAEV